MFMYQLIFRLCRDKKIPFYSSNHEQPTDHLLNPDIGHDFCFGPQRNFKALALEFSKPVEIRNIIQLRDPRDILVSQYYSFGWSHSDEGFDHREYETRDQIRGITVDEYALNATGAVEKLKLRLKPLLRKPPCEDDCVVHYEQMVTDFRGWLTAVIQPFEFSRFGLRSERIILAKYAFRYRNEFRPDNRPNSHKRSVLPGDFRRKLKPETIRKLNASLKPQLDFLGYDSKGLRFNGYGATDYASKRRAKKFSA